MNLIVVMQVSAQLPSPMAAYASTDATSTEQSGTDGNQGNLIGFKHTVALILSVDVCIDAVSRGALLSQVAGFSCAKVQNVYRIRFVARLHIGHEEGHTEGKCKRDPHFIILNTI